jgi:hypothetical protein
MANWTHNRGFHKGDVKISAELCAQHTAQRFSSPLSRKQPFLLFDAKMGVDALQHTAGGDLGEFFGFDFVEASAVNAAFRNQFGGVNPL